MGSRPGQDQQLAVSCYLSRQQCMQPLPLRCAHVAVSLMLGVSLPCLAAEEDTAAHPDLTHQVKAVYHEALDALQETEQAYQQARRAQDRVEKTAQRVRAFLASSYPRHEKLIVWFTQRLAGSRKAKWLLEQGQETKAILEKAVTQANDVLRMATKASSQQQAVISQHILHSVQPARNQALQLFQKAEAILLQAEGTFQELLDSEGGDLGLLRCGVALTPHAPARSQAVLSVLADQDLADEPATPRPAYPIRTLAPLGLAALCAVHDKLYAAAHPEPAQQPLADSQDTLSFSFLLGWAALACSIYQAYRWYLHRPTPPVPQEPTTRLTQPAPAQPLPQAPVHREPVSIPASLPQDTAAATPPALRPRILAQVAALMCLVLAVGPLFSWAKARAQDPPRQALQEAL